MWILRFRLCLFCISIGCFAECFLQPELALQRISTVQLHSEKLFAQSVYDTIGDGKIGIIPDFIPQDEMRYLRQDAGDLYHQNKFSTDALASYGSSGKFDPAKDRA
eukprot:scaffold4531_cov103-Cylindrotheca_fusiformis.AAC.1